MPNHTSYGFNDNESKYFQRLEEWLKSTAQRMGVLREFIEHLRENTETIRALEARITELENRADQAGI